MFGCTPSGAEVAPRAEPRGDSTFPYKKKPALENKSGFFYINTKLY
jgi:hypothetical protein